MSEVEQTALTRNLLARLDVAILDLEDEQRRAHNLRQELHESIACVGAIQTRLKAIRDGLRPLLDSSAPVKFPYDRRT